MTNLRAGRRLPIIPLWVGRLWIRRLREGRRLVRLTRRKLTRTTGIRALTTAGQPRDRRPSYRHRESLTPGRISLGRSRSHRFRSPDLSLETADRGANGLVRVDSVGLGAGGQREDFLAHLVGGDQVLREP